MTAATRPAATVSGRTDPARQRPLRVGLVCPYSLSAPGGVQNHVLGLAGYLTAAGDQVAILAPGELDPERAGQHGIHPEQFTSVGAAIPVPYNGSVARITFGPRVAARVRRWLTAQQLDLVHIHEPLAPSVSLLSLLACTVPVAATFHTATPRSRLLRAAGVALRPVIDRIGAGIAVSESARQVVVEHLGRQPRVVPNGIRSGEFDPPAQHPEDDHGTGEGRSVADRPWRGGDRPRLVFLGRLDEPRKGLAVLLDALPMIKQRHPDLEVVIAGQGNLSRIGRRDAAAQLPDGCWAIGEVDDTTRDALLRTADLFVAPHVARESFGIVLIEAIAAGATVIASDLPAFNDLLTDRGRRLGYLFPTGDPAALAGTVDRALRADRRELNADARTAVARYDWSKVGPTVRDVYRDLLSH
ncbi:glycosyltransferase family 4 protein [Microlunatus soli]|uniref:glycosyltransferase family 4 protein n=1 Tax=Microlunatus soli TaxID=630515 RepID=UPI00155F8ABF|nr:glycosyltransferase family 4 protein [Microlunatus soli]